MPSAEQPRTPPKAPAIIAACALCAALTASYEGLRTKPYRDPIGKMTVCYGETEREMRVYTKQECADLLKQRQQSNYAPAILKCVPAFIDERRRNAFAASIDAAYNAGIAAFCRSRMAASFNAGQWKQGCEGFRGWYVLAAGKKLPGLVKRREAERALCLAS
jgi:lysozyme